MNRERRINVGINKYNILQCIARNDRVGIGTSGISKQTKLHRDTVRRLSKELENEFLIFRRRKGDRYHLTKKARGSPDTIPLFLGGEGLVQMRFWNPICSSNKFCNNTLTQRLIRSKGREITAKDILYIHGSKSVEELVLFEFANRIGALITYLLIQALRPKKSEITIDSRAFGLETTDEYELARNYIRKAIAPESILDIFVALPLLNRRFRHTKGRDKKLSDVINEQDFHRLNETFTYVYSDIFQKLETIRNKIPAELEEIYAEMNEFMKNNTS